MFIIWHEDADGHSRIYSSEGPLRLGRQEKRLYQSNFAEYLTIPGLHGASLDNGTVLIQVCGETKKQLVGKFKLVGCNNIDESMLDLL